MGRGVRVLDLVRATDRWVRGAFETRGRRRCTLTSLLADRSFRLYWAGQAISALGDAFAFVAYPLLVLDATGSVAAMGAVSAVTAGTHLLTGLVAGPIVDAADRRRLMIGCDLGRLGVFSLIPLVWWIHGPSLPALVVSVVIGSALGNVFSVAYVTATPDLVDRERLTEANGKLQGTQGLAFVLGPMLAGVVAAKVGSVWAIGIDALSFGVSAASLASLRLRREGRRTTPKGSLLDGVRFLRKEPVLRAVTLLFVLLAILSNGTIAAGILDVLIFHLRHTMGASDATVGAALGVGAVGAVVGALTASPLRRRFGFAACFVGATAVQGIALLCMGSGRSAWTLAIAVAIWTAGMSTRGVVTQTLRQEVTPDALLGRVTSAFWTIAAVLAPVGAALVTRLADRWGTFLAFRAAGAGVLLTALFALYVIVPAAKESALRPAA
jgi:MFS family permease